jgi:Protein of unknown function (DUF3015)
MKKLLLAIPAALLLAAPIAHAGNYGAAGCGLGSLVFGTKPGVYQIIAATLNGTGVQTFGITTGTSNCDGALIGNAGAKVFIEANKEALAKDISRGQGETITNLSQLAGCQDASAVGAVLQKKFDVLFPAGGSQQTADSIVGELKAAPALACSKLG